MQLSDRYSFQSYYLRLMMTVIPKIARVVLIAGVVTGLLMQLRRLMISVQEFHGNTRLVMGVVRS